MKAQYPYNKYDPNVVQFYILLVERQLQLPEYQTFIAIMAKNGRLRTGSLNPPYDFDFICPPDAIPFATFPKRVLDLSTHNQTELVAHIFKKATAKLKTTGMPIIHRLLSTKGVRTNTINATENTIDTISCLKYTIKKALNDSSVHNQIVHEHLRYNL